MSTPGPADPVRAATEALEAAIQAVPELTVAQLHGTSPDPPAATVGPPRLTWSTGCLDPTEATFLVFVGVPADDQWRTRLWSLLPQVVRAIDEADRETLDASVISAAPSPFPYGSAELPGYVLEVEVAL